MDMNELSSRQFVQVSAWVKFLFIITSAIGFALIFSGIFLLYG